MPSHRAHSRPHKPSLASAGVRSVEPGVPVAGQPTEGSPEPARESPRNDACPALLVLSGRQLGEVFELRAVHSVVGRDSGLDVCLRDGAISRRHAKLFVKDDAAYVEDLSSRNGTFVNGRRIHGKTQLAAGDYIAFAGTVVKFSTMAALERRALRRLLDLTLRDPLTNLYNRRYFEERLQSEFSYARRHEGTVSVLLIDIDHFKAVNDTHGHHAGDVVLARVGALLRNAIRPEDVVARYGGEEFVILTRGGSRADAEALAERVRRTVEATPFAIGKRTLAIRVSIGVAALSPTDACSNGAALIAAADRALYRAKAAGRNRVASSRFPERPSSPGVKSVRTLPSSAPRGSRTG